MATDPKLPSDPAPDQEASWSNEKLGIISEVDDAGVMSTRCRLTLQKARQDFVRDLDVMATLDCLFSKLVFTQEDCQTVRGKRGDMERRRTLLDILPERGQRAYDELCKHLKIDQDWLLAVLQKNYDSITKSDLMDAVQQHQGQNEGSSELGEALKENLRDKLQEWKTALEEGCPGSNEHLDYIDQPCTLTTDAQSPPEHYSSTIKVVEDSQPGDRLHRKTTLLKQLTSCWIDKSNSPLARKFKYLFLIPLRLVGNSSLLSILCDELGLLPKSSEADLKKSLELNERKVLFLLDSYEELREDVKMQETEVGDLIKRRLFPKSTVIVTSRPGSRLPLSEHQKTAQLNDLPKEKVEEKIKHLFGENEAVVGEALESFPAMSFLQKPINLALFLFVLRNDKEFKTQESFSQAELFNQVLQYMMLAYAKKRQFKHFTPQPGSYLNNREIPRDIRRLFRDIAKRCFEEIEVNYQSFPLKDDVFFDPCEDRKEKDLVLNVEDSGDLEDYLYFGLFTAGPDKKSIVVPHRLFKEYFGAAHLAEDSRARRVLFEEIKQKLESETRHTHDLRRGFPHFQSSSISLLDVVQHMGVENILRFLVSLAPQVCQEIGSLFVLERANFEVSYYYLVNVEFYADLLKNCSSDSGKHALATALVNAPVRNVEDLRDDSTVNCSGLLAFMPYLTNNQCIVLLKKAFNLDVCQNKGKLAIPGACDDLTILDAFVVAFIFKNDVIISTDKLSIIGFSQRVWIPASLLSRNMQGVRELHLWNCDVVGLPMNLHLAPFPENGSLSKVFLLYTGVLPNCDVITSRQCELDMVNCGKVTVSTLRTCFPKLSKLGLERTSVVYTSEEELISWLSTIQSLESLYIAAQHEGETLCLNHFLNMDFFSKRRELVNAYVSEYRILQSVQETAPVNPQNTLEHLKLDACKDVDLGKLLEVCSQCRKLKTLYMVKCQIQVNVKDICDTAQHTCKLDELLIMESEGVLDLGLLFELFGLLGHPNELWLEAVDLTLDDRNVESLPKLPDLQRFTLVSGEWLFESPVHTPSGRAIKKKELEQQLSRVCPSAQIRFWDSQDKLRSGCRSILNHLGHLSQA